MTNTLAQDHSLDEIAKPQAPLKAQPGVVEEPSGKQEYPQKQPGEKVPEPSVDSLAQLFQERDQGADQKKGLQKRTDELGKLQPLQSLSKQSSRQEENKPTETAKAAPEAAETQEVDQTPDLEALQQELARTQKRLTENQQYGRHNAQRLKQALKITQELMAEGSLSEEEALRLKEALESEISETPEDLGTTEGHPFARILSIANQELENIRRYTDDTRLDDKVRAFDHFLLIASPQDQEQALEELQEVLDQPLALAKKMLAFGQQYQSSYQAMKKAGGLQALLEQKDQEIAILGKKLDKLTQKLSHYEDYDKPRYRLEDRGPLGAEAPLKDTVSSLFDERDRVRPR